MDPFRMKLHFPGGRMEPVSRNKVEDIVLVHEVKGQKAPGQPHA